MRKILFKLLAMSMVIIGLALPIKSYAIGTDTAIKESCSNRANELNQKQRKLWSDHISWTRSFVVSDLASLEDKQAVLGRLLKNQDDIGDSFKPYYGKENSKKLSALLREHISIAGQVVDAAKAGKQDDLVKYNKQWYENADKIAEFLSTINPNWPKNTVKDIFYKHLQLLTEQVVSMLKKNWNGDIQAYDKGEAHMLMFADIISKGIMKQFPEKFK